MNALFLKNTTITVIMSCRRGGPVLPGAANKTGVVPATSKPSSEQVVVMMLVVIMMLVSMMLSWY